MVPEESLDSEHKPASVLTCLGINRMLQPPVTWLSLQENYLNHKPANAKTEEGRLRIAAKAADSLAQGDVVPPPCCLFPGAYDYAC